MKLFIELYCDEDVSVLLPELLKGNEYKALITREAKMLGKSDEEQLEFAAKNSYTLLTHNRVD